LIPAEKANPHSQERIPNENIPLVWAQSLFILGSLIQDGLLAIDDIDPLGRYKAVKQKDYKLQVALLAQDEVVQNSLLAEGIDTQTLAEIVPIQVREAIELAEAYTQVGRNDRIGLTGRPLRQLRTLATSKVYVLSGERLVFLPQCLNQKGFYLAMDNRLLMQRLRLEFSYIYKHWDRMGSPLVVMNIKQNMLGSHNRKVLIDFIKELQSGFTQGISVQMGLLSDFAETANYEKINYLHDFKFSAASWEETERPFFQVLPTDAAPSSPLDTPLLTKWEISPDVELIEQLQFNANLYAQLEALTLLSSRHGLDYNTGLTGINGVAGSLRDLLEEIYERAGDRHIWYIVRRCAGLLGKYDINLEQAATDILVRQHALTLGRAYSGRATLTRPADSSDILQTIRTYNTNNASEHIIIQELILYLGMLIKSNPALFTDMHTVRVGHILQLTIVRQKRESDCTTLDQAFNEILAIAPYQLFKKVKETLEDYGNTEDQLNLDEALHYEGSLSQPRPRALTSAQLSKDGGTKSHGTIVDEWYEWREQQGSVGRENNAFFACVWDILHHCKGLMIGDKLNSKNRLDSETTLAQMTSGEQSFKLHVNHLLNKIQSAVYRQITVEALKAMSSIFRENTSLYIEDTLVVDIIIDHAVRIHWLQTHPGSRENYEYYVSQAWQDFYQLEPYRVANSVLDALVHLLNNN
jgi:phosphorylase kinase alpha/beta subunit